MPSTVVITGATGFIGRSLVEALRSRATAHAVSRVPRDSMADVVWHAVDLRDADAVNALMKKVDPDVVYHLAAPAESDRSLPEAAVRDAIITATENILAAAAQSSRVRVVVAGSAKEYGSVSRGERLVESGPAEPLTSYARAKLAVVDLVRRFHDRHGVAAIILRLFPVYGPGMGSHSVVLQAVAAACENRPLRMTEGRQTRDLVFIDDAVKGFLAAARASVGYSGVVNLCSGQPITVRKLVTRVYQLAESTAVPLFGAVEPWHGEIWHLCGDPVLAEQHLHWTAETPLDVGLRRMIDVFRRERAGASESVSTALDSTVHGRRTDVDRRADTLDAYDQ